MKIFFILLYKIGKLKNKRERISTKIILYYLICVIFFAAVVVAAVAVVDETLKS